MGLLPHAERMEKMLRNGDREAAAREHNRRVRAELARAEMGATINLSDLMAGREAFVLDSIREAGEDEP